MKKYFLSSLLIIMISLVWAKSHFLDMRVGDFGCVTRVVFEFTGKIDSSIKGEGNNISIVLNSLKEGKIQLPIEPSKNIKNISLEEGTEFVQVDLEFSYPIESISDTYFLENNNYVIVLDVYDVEYKTDKNKALATLLFKGQKFPLSKSSAEIAKFSKEYITDPLVNLYLGRLFATKKMKENAIEYFKKIPEGTEQFFTAQAYIDNLNKNKYPLDEVKPDFLEIKPEVLAEVTGEIEETKVKDIASEDLQKVTDKEKQEKDNDHLFQDKKEDKSTSAKSSDNKLWYILLGVSIIIIVFQFIQIIKNKMLVNELNIKLEGSNFELKALENKLEKGVIENSKTKDRIIIKLYNNGWKPEDIANELSTSLETVEATISKESKL